MALEPLQAGWVGEALRLDDPVDVARAFAVWGGVPRYWELAEPFGADLVEAVDTLVLDPLGPLAREPDRLLREELPPAISLRPILDVIGAGASRVSEIAGRLGQPATSLSRPLSRLVELGLVRREHPFGDPERSGKRSLYRIADPLCRLWFRVVAPHRAFLAQASPSARRGLLRRAAPALFSEGFEDLCRACVPRLPAGPEGVRDGSGFGPASRFWRGSGPEWDVVSSGGDGRRLLLGKVKWLARPATSAALRRMGLDLSAKGRPPFATGREEVRRLLFVPRIERGARPPEGFEALDAASVLAVLRELRTA
jgi:hypothetical protein